MNHKINRKQFLRICGTAIAGSAIAALPALLLHRRKVSRSLLCETGKTPGLAICQACRRKCPLRKE